MTDNRKDLSARIADILNHLDEHNAQLLAAYADGFAMAVEMMGCKEANAR